MHFSFFSAMCCAYYLYIYRATSRILEIMFSKPTCGPKCAAEMEVYQELAQVLNGDVFSKAVGFIVKLGKCLQADGSKQVKEIQKELQFSHSLMERNVCGWSILLFFLEKVFHQEHCIHWKHCKHSAVSGDTAVAGNTAVTGDTPYIGNIADPRDTAGTGDIAVTGYPEDTAYTGDTAFH